MAVASVFDMGMLFTGQELSLKQRMVTLEKRVLAGRDALSGYATHFSRVCWNPWFACFL